MYGFDKKETSADRTIVDNILTDKQIYKYTIVSYIIGLIMGIILAIRLTSNMALFDTIFFLLWNDPMNFDKWHTSYLLLRSHTLIRSCVTLLCMGVFIAYSYTARPFLFKYRGLGDLLILIAYGPLLVSAAYLVQTHTLPSLIQLAFFALPIGCMTDAVLHANNTRDAVVDKAAGATTLATRFGPDGCYYFLIFLYSFAYSSCFICCWYFQSFFFLLPLVTLPISRKITNCFAVRNWTDICEQCGQLSFMFALLQSLALFCSSSNYLRVS
jgi:1,4-dihydroxy-2-naphthoate octaprenyltransferase